MSDALPDEEPFLLSEPLCSPCSQRACCFLRPAPCSFPCKLACSWDSGGQFFSFISVAEPLVAPLRSVVAADPFVELCNWTPALERSWSMMLLAANAGADSANAVVARTVSRVCFILYLR